VPGYGGTGQAQLLRENRQVFLFQQEPVVAGISSIAIQPERNRRSNPSGASFQIYFTDANGNPANPGPFEIDIQDSDIDEDSQYCASVQWNGNGGLNGNYVGRVELPVVLGKYIRAFVKALANPVYATIQITDFPGVGGNVALSSNFLTDAPSDGVAYGREDANWVPVVNLAGDTMTGPLILSGDPTVPLQAATMEYVDTFVNTVTAALSGVLTFTGTIDGPTGTCNFYGPLEGTPSGPLPAAVPANKNYYFICTASGTPPSGPEAGVALTEGNWLLSTGSAWTLLLFSVETLAGEVIVNPAVAGATDVQTALTNINTNQGNYLPLAGGTMTGTLSMATGNIQLTNGSINVILGGVNVSGSGGINTASGLGISGAGLNFGSRQDSNPQSMLNHVILWSTTFGFGVTGGQLNYNVDSSSAHVFYVGSTEIARINGAGITFGSANQAYLNWVNNTSAASGPNTVIQACDGAGRMLWRLMAQESGAIVGGNPEGTFHFYANEGGYGNHHVFWSLISSPAQVQSEGAMNAPAFTVTSDRKLKKNIRAAEEYEHLSAFAALKAVRYEWAKDGDEQWSRPKWGFVADEVEKASAELVHTHADGLKGYDMTQVLVLAVAEIQRLSKLVEQPWYRRVSKPVKASTPWHRRLWDKPVEALVNGLRLFKSLKLVKGS
jgi:hypothetical protein